MEYRIALLRGDGIGPEIVDSAVRVLERIGERFGHRFCFTPYLIGGCAIDATGKPLPEETVEGCLASDSVLFVYFKRERPIRAKMNMLLKPDMTAISENSSDIVRISI